MGVLASLRDSEIASRISRWGPRLGALAGLAFTVLLVGSLFVGASTLEDPDQSALATVGDWSKRHDQLGLRLALLEAAAFFGLWFTAEVHTRLSSTGAHREAALALSGGVLLVAVLAVSGSPAGAVLAVDNLEQDPQVAKVLFLIDWTFRGGLVAALAAFVAASAVAALRTDVLPKWLSWLGIALVVLFAANGAIWQTAAMSLIGLLWIPVAAIVLMVRD